MTLPRTFARGGAAAALLLLPAAAAAQLSLPLPAGAQAGTGTGAAASAPTSIAVPTGQAPGVFRPDVIEATPDPADASPPSPVRTPEPPAPPSEFEAYVAGVAGKPIPRFGANLLVPEARDFTAPATVAVPPDYRINPGDELRLGLSGSVQAALRLKVDADGRIFIPHVGAVTVAGLRYADLQATIAREVSRRYLGFTLEVTVARLRGLTIYVTGHARRPGAYTVSSLSTLVNAVLAAGGPAPGGSFRRIALRRGGALVSDFDLYDLLLRGDTRGDAALQNGDVITIAPAGDQVAVIGSVNTEAVFEIAPDETVTDAVRYAGGVSTIADATRLLVLDALDRAGGWRQLGAAEAATRTARRGDVIRVLSDAGIARPIGTQPVLVTLAGEVARPGRYYVAPGTRLADVVAQAGGLTRDAFPYASVVTRESVKAQQRASYARAIGDMELLLRTQPLVSPRRGQVATPELVSSVVERMKAREPNGRLVFDLPVDAAALPGDLVLENDDAIYVPTRPITVGVFGAVPSPATFSYRPGSTIGDVIAAAGGIGRLGDRSGVFVVRANGRVLAEKRRTLRAPALPGDLVYVPLDADRGAFWERLRDVSGALFAPALGAASLKGLVD